VDVPADLDTSVAVTFRAYGGGKGGARAANGGLGGDGGGSGGYATADISLAA
jgi:hypothetical protein